jgi:signal peptidase I
MAKKKTAATRRDPPAAPANDATIQSGPSHFVVFRETIESVVVAFVLAFLFRTFEAEAFVIPTGSMSPSLQGRHKDLHCTECGYRFRTSASTEEAEEIPNDHYKNLYEAEVVGGTCPMCSFPMPFTRDLPAHAQEEIAELADFDDIDFYRTYPGDRILVNKYGFDFSEPVRWDVIVFKFPGDGNMNYIKRLVGMPGETLRIFQGDIFTQPLDAAEDDNFRLQPKPADKVAAMLQPVHDTDFEPVTLHKAGWPLRWAATTPDGWEIDAEDGEQTVEQSFSVDQKVDSPEAWLRYRHIVAERVDDWVAAASIAAAGSIEGLAEHGGVSVAEAERAWADSMRPQLVSDFNAYNAALTRKEVEFNSWRSLESFLGMNWVGDLAVEADVEVVEARGELTLDLVEAGYHFRVTIDLKDGAARLAIVDGRTGEPLGFAATADTGLNSAGTYRLRFANVDDQLLLWIDDELVAFDKVAYEPDDLFQGGRQGMIPWAGETGEDQGDLAPVGVAARGAKLNITRLAVLRDVYYLAASHDIVRSSPEAMHMDYRNWRTSATTPDGVDVPPLSSPRELLANPEAWPRFLTRRDAEFPIEEHQLFAMGDNSPFSQDCRLWTINPPWRGKPGGAYLDRRLLIGKAICVFWPHSWGAIPGLPKLPGWPNFGDMRLVR